KGKPFLYPRCARGPFDTLRNFLDLVARVAIVIPLPRLLRPPPRLCIAAVTAKKEYLTNGPLVLADRRRKLWLVDQHVARPISFQQRSNLRAIFVPTTM